MGLLLLRGIMFPREVVTFYWTGTPMNWGKYKTCAHPLIRQWNWLALPTISPAPSPLPNHNSNHKLTPSLLPPHSGIASLRTTTHIATFALVHLVLDIFLGGDSRDVSAHMGGAASAIYLAGHFRKARGLAWWAARWQLWANWGQSLFAR